MSYRCLNCGGKMQPGGKVPFIDAYSNFQVQPTQIQGIDNSYRPANMNVMSPASTFKGNYPATGAPILPMVGPSSVTSTTTMSPNGFYSQHHLRQGLGLLSEISGRVERNRQDQYDMQQQTQLGLMNPMPVNDYQPNPYSLYAKYGGMMKSFVRDHQKFSNKARMDMDSYQMGGIMQAGGRPTTQDSLNLYNNAISLQNYYSKYSKTPNDPAIDASKPFEALDKAKQSLESRLVRGRNPNTTSSPYSPDNSFSMYDYHRQASNPNQFYQREITNEKLDTNAPMALYDKRIKPTRLNSYINNQEGSPLQNDIVETFGYDPVKIKPYNMLSNKEKAMRMSQGTPARVRPPVPAPPPAPNYRPSNVQGPMDLTANPNIQANVTGQTVTPVDPGFQYGTVESGPYNPNSGQSVYSKGKILGYKDNKGNAVDKSYFGILKKGGKSKYRGK